MDLNSKIKGTKSNKIRKVTYLKRFILEKIDENQKIKRYLRYTNKLPLAKKSQNYDGVLVMQPDLSESLMQNCKEGEKSLFGGSFNPEMSNLKTPNIYVHSHRIQSYGADSTMSFVLHILCPQTYNELQSYGRERVYEIADEIVQMLDGYVIDEKEIVDVVGNLTLDFEGDFSEYRLAKSSDVIVLSIPLKIKNVGIRSSIYDKR